MENDERGIVHALPEKEADLPGLAGRVFCITGAASGIGASIARVLAGMGATLVLADVNAQRLERVASEIRGLHGAAVSIVCGDVSLHDVNADIVATALVDYERLDGIVINAGIATTGMLADLTAEAWHRCMQVNLFSAFSLTQQALRALTTQGRGGSIVYIASKNAFGPGKGFGAYSVSKAAMVQLARIAAIEGGEHGIRCNVVNPDSVFEGSQLWSPEIRRQRAAAHGVQEDELEEHYAQRNLLQASISGADVGEAVAFLLSERARRTTGCVLTVDGGVPAAFPR
ncbi:MAG: SDR family oxidoreductase [Arthrobacter sp.]